MSPRWDAFQESTEPFRLMYAQVTKAIRRFAENRPPEESAWIQKLVDGFEREYRAWETTPSPAIRAYLRKVDEHGRDSRLLRLIGHAYLHISYDLPRVIAESTLASGLSESQARTVYELMMPLFRRVWADSVRRPEVVGNWAAGFRLLAQDYLDVSVYYVLALRYQAWSNSRRMNPSTEQQLGEWVYFYLNDTPRTRNPVRWIARLQPPVLRDDADFTIGPETLRETPERSGLTGKLPSGH
jgi:hypothetical protein